MNIRQLEDQIKSEKILFSLIENNDIQKLKLLINDVKPSPNLNAKNKNEDTPLCVAIQNNNALIVEALIEAKADVHTKNKNGDTPLSVAIKNNNASICGILIEANADVNAKNYQGETPLFAVNDDTCLQLLLRAKADLSATDNNNNTALMHAARYNRLESVRLLLSAKADVSIRNKDGEDAIALASNFDYIDQPYGFFKCNNPTKKLLEAAQPNHHNRSRHECKII